jgi:hypothetical protein
MSNKFTVPEVALNWNRSQSVIRSLYVVMLINLKKIGLHPKQNYALHL